MAEARSSGFDVAGHGILKTAPRGFPRDHPRIELLRYKGIVAWHEWPPASWLETKKARDRVVEFFRASKPLNEWLKRYVGPSEMPADRR